MALRVAILGGIALVMFGVIFFRLWYLQVLTGEQYVQEAAANAVRELPIPAPRGQILDREGKPIAASTVTNAVQIVPSALPPAGHPRLVLYRRLGALLGMSAAHIEAARDQGPHLASLRARDDQDRRRAGRADRARRAPERIPRRHPAARLDSHLSLRRDGRERARLRRPGLRKRARNCRAFRGVQQGTVVGQEGLEYYYDRYLRGRDGERRVQVNSEGYPVPTRLQPTPPKAGYSLKTTLDFGLQREGEKALLEGIENARAGGKPATAGAFVAMNPLNGEVLAIGSWPTFDPNKFAKPLTDAEYAKLEGKTGPGGEEVVPSPLIDRAINGAYPTGSTFKPITAMAALEGGVINPTEGLGAGSCIEPIGGGGEQFCNSGHTDYGAVGLVEALKVSSDTYFFTVGELANSHGNVIQNKAHELGIGHPTGIDLPSETTGTIPSRQWLAEQNKQEYQCTREHHGHPCDIVAEPGEPWTVGYNMDLAVGQGSLQTDPLQMAVAYSTLANAYLHGGDGTVVTPAPGDADRRIQRRPGAEPELPADDATCT